MHVDTLGRANEHPRALTREEYQVMAAIVNDDCPGAPTLRAQLETARVLRNWPPPGSPSIDLVVAEDAPAVPQDESVLPMNAHVYDEQGGYLGELVVWMAHGRLAALEYAWVTDSMPTSLPELGALRISPR